MDRTKLSQESNRFIENLRLYLFSKGKKQADIEEVAEELAEHLYEAEQNGKSIEQIVGKSPQEYMESIEEEMNKDPVAWWIIPFILIGSTVFMVYDDLLRGVLFGEMVGYSLWRIAGTAVIGIFFVIGFIVALRYTSKNQFSDLKANGILAIPIGMSMLLFFVIYLMDGYMETPIITINTLGSIILLIVLTIFVIGASIWAKTWILPVILAAFVLPPLLLESTSLGIDMQAFLGFIITIGIVGVYMYLVFRNNEK